MGLFRRKPKLRRKPVTVIPPEPNLRAWRYLKVIQKTAEKNMVARSLFGLMVIGAAAFGAFIGLLLVYSTDLPQVSDLERYRPSAVTELYDDQGRVVASFALQRRIIIGYEDIPLVLKDAVLSIEDRDFESHWGVDVRRVAGALYRDLSGGGVHQGASTLTMQLSRKLFLSDERTASRKIQETLLAIQIERRFTKPQIFTMYANQIYLGHGVYGFAAGAQYYFGKQLKDLNLEEAAMLAALPKSGIVYSPITNPANALKRRNLVLNAMVENGKIKDAQALIAKEQPIRLNLQPTFNSLAPNFAEEVRHYLEKKYGSEDVHEHGLKVYTTINLDLQRSAMKAALDGVAAYERRHGWKGKLKNVLATGESLETYKHSDWSQPFEIGGYVHALVTETSPLSATVKFGHNLAQLTSADMAWIASTRSPSQLLKPGDIVYLRIVSLPSTGDLNTPIKVALEQDSGAQVALIAVDNATGDIKAMVGGRDFNESKFNRATQALRQVGSSFKPYVYTAALDTGTISPEDNVVDAPITFMTAGGPYTPSNYDGKFWGTIPFAKAVANSRNIPALKIAEQTGIGTVIEYTRRFGITSPLPPVLPLALGAAEITLYEQTSAYTAFPNDGVRVSPRYIRKVLDYENNLREEEYAGVSDVIPAQTARTMVQLLQGVVRAGTATAALKLNHPVAGKTGTTNDFTDAWFVGFSPSITCGVWVGFDEKVTLGRGETGGLAALPIWIDFMKVALQGHDGEDFTAPEKNPKKPTLLNAAASVPFVKDAEAAGIVASDSSPAVNTIASKPATTPVKTGSTKPAQSKPAGMKSARPSETGAQPKPSSGIGPTTGAGTTATAPTLPHDEHH